MSYSIIYLGDSLHKMIDWNRLKLNAGGRISKFFIEKKIFYSLEFNHSPTVWSLHWFLFLFSAKTLIHCALICILFAANFIFFFAQKTLVIVATGQVIHTRLQRATTLFTAL